MPTKFSDLGVPQWIVEALNQRGITEPFEIQEISINDTAKITNIILG